MKTIAKNLIIGALFFFSTAASAQEKTTAEIKIKTSAQCEHCQKRIEERLHFTKGVKSAKLDLTTKMATIVYDPNKATPEKLKAAIAKAGYDADDIPADKKAYEKLPKCCKKPG